MSMSVSHHRTMGSLGPASSSLIVIGLMLLTMFASTARAANVLKDIAYSALPGDRVQVSLTLASPTDAPQSFTMDNPSRIVLDLLDTTSGISKRSQAVGVGLLRSITAVEAGGRTRVVMNMIASAEYETRLDGAQIHLIIGSKGGDITPTGSAPIKQLAAGSGVSNAANSLDDVDFRRGPEGQGRVMITLSNPATIVDVREEGQKIVLEFVDSTLPERLSRRLDVTDFATPVTMVDTRAEGNNVRMVVEATGHYEFLSYQADNLFTLEFRPATKEEIVAAQKERFQYTGDRLSLNFQDIEVRAVLQLLADFTGLNMVTSDTVSGNVTLRLKNVPWDQALDLVLKTKGLSKREVGNVVLVAPTEEIAAREKLELESEQQIEELAPLRSDFIQVNYAKASDLTEILKSTDNRLLSERGNVTVDERTNTLLVQDTAAKLEDIRRLIAKLDIPVRQVLIESRIVIAADDFSNELGVRLGLTNVYNRGDKTAVVGGGLAGDLDTSAITGGTVIDIPAGDPETEALITDLPVAGAAGAVNLLLGKLGGKLLRLELSAMQAEGRGEVLSSPRLITSDQHEAVIKQGVEIPYEESTSSGATSVSFKEAVLSLAVTPQITPDDRVIMTLEVSKDSVGETFRGSGGSEIPSIDTRTISTKVLVDNGETVVLGGIYEEAQNSSTTKVPFFGDLPVLGFAFRNESEVNDSRELLIFVTPKIIKESLTLR